MEGLFLQSRTKQGMARFVFLEEVLIPNVT